MPIASGNFQPIGLEIYAVLERPLVERRCSVVRSPSSTRTAKRRLAAPERRVFRLEARMNERDKTHDLALLIQQATAELTAEYRRIQARVAEDPGTAGDQGEENWATLLRKWLPAGFHVRTKGRIIGVDGSASPQVDVLVLSPSYPVGLLDKKLYLAAGVVAAFECKLTLRRDHIRKVVKNSVALGKISRQGGSSGRHIIYGILAHSHVVPAKRDSPGIHLEKGD
jgi:hypothetical protein